MIMDQVAKLITEALKNKQKERLEALRFLKSVLMENKTSQSPRPEMDAIISHHKRLKDSLMPYPEGSVQQKNIASEMAVVEEFMPKPLGEGEVIVLIQDIKSKLEKPTMGAIMKELTPQIKGRFDGKRASELAQKACIVPS